MGQQSTQAPGDMGAFAIGMPFQVLPPSKAESQPLQKSLEPQKATPSGIMHHNIVQPLNNKEENHSDIKMGSNSSFSQHDSLFANENNQKNSLTQKLGDLSLSQQHILCEVPNPSSRSVLPQKRENSTVCNIIFI